MEFWAWPLVLWPENVLFPPGPPALVAASPPPKEQGPDRGGAEATSALGRPAGPPLIGKMYDVSHVTSFLLAGFFMAVPGLAAFSLAPLAHHAPPPSAS